MASKMFLFGLQEIVQADIDLDGDDIRVGLCMTNNTCATDADDGTVTVMNDVTLDEGDATGYGRQALANEAVALDDANDWVEFDADDAVFSGLSGDASRDYDGAIILKHVTNDTDSPPIAWSEFSADVVKESTQVTVQWNAEGIIQFAGP